MTMLAKIISDVNILSVKGIYNAATPTVLVRQWILNRIHTALLATQIIHVSRLKQMPSRI
jgi:hypothetical protein